MAETLFDISMRAWNAPVQADIQKQQLLLDKQAVQNQAIDLQNKIGLQQDMAKIWGPNGTASAENAIASGDITSSPKFIATAQALATRGQPQAAASYLSGLSMLGERASITKKNNQQVQWRTAERTGSILGAVSDESGYTNALAQLKAENIDPASLGLVGDWKVDGPKLPQLARSAMTSAQQLQAQDREQAHSDTEAQRNIANGFVQQRLGQGAQRLSVQENLAQLAHSRFNWQQGEADKRDSRAQAGLDLRSIGAEDRSFANASRLQKPESDIAQGIFQTDQRTMDLPDPLKKSLATLAARRAKQQIASDMMNNGDSEYEPEDFGAALNEQINQMQRQGLFKTEGDYTFNPPKPPPAAAKAPVQPPLPKSMNAVPKGIPEGSKVVGKSPDGKAVWQDPKGGKWVE
jgi:hypothetical protein